MPGSPCVENRGPMSSATDKLTVAHMVIHFMLLRGGVGDSASGSKPGPQRDTKYAKADFSS